MPCSLNADVLEQQWMPTSVANELVQRHGCHVERKGLLNPHQFAVTVNVAVRVTEAAVPVTATVKVLD